MSEIVKVNTDSVRFVDRVLAECRASANTEVVMSGYQRGLVQGYFLTLDSMLKAAETKRQSMIAAGSKYASPTPYDWNHINLQQVALDCLSYSRMGLDSQARNHIYPIAYHNKSAGRYDINFMIGYRGLGLIAKKYGIDPPENITCELVYSNDTFAIKKKGGWNDGDSFTFEVTNPFDRGSIVGGFAYFSYADSTKNRIYTITKAELDKRKKPENIQFWGGVKDKWENGKKVGQEVVEGWATEMYQKTLERWAYNKIELDPEKVDESVKHMQMRELEMTKMQMQEEIEQKANMIVIDDDTGGVNKDDPVDF